MAALLLLTDDQGLALLPRPHSLLLGPDERVVVPVHHQPRALEGAVEPQHGQGRDTRGCLDQDKVQVREERQGEQECDGLPEGLDHIGQEARQGGQELGGMGAWE